MLKTFEKIWVVGFMRLVCQRPSSWTSPGIPWRVDELCHELRRKPEHRHIAELTCSFGRDEVFTLAEIPP